MGKIISAYVVPHPPIIIPEIGKGEESAASSTVRAMQKFAEDVKNDKPSTVIITTPHGPVFQDFIHISSGKTLSGSFGRFAAPEVRFSFENDTDLADRIIKYANEEGIYSGGLDENTARRYHLSKELDHGALVPLYYINKVYPGFKIVHISIAFLPFIELYRFGMCVEKAVEESENDVVFVASGDLSHRLSKDAPYGYSRHGKEFDEILVESVRTLDVKRLLQLDESFCESAGECGLRSFLMMFGALDGHRLKSHVYSYEGPFGVGYAVAKLEVGERSPEREIYRKISEETSRELRSIRENEDPYVVLARTSLETFVKEGRIIGVPGNVPEEMKTQRAGAFVSIKKHGQLRGCIGTIGPTRKNIAEEIIYNAISAGTQDPRFNPVEEDELGSLIYSVDVLKEPEPISSTTQLDVRKYGVIVRKGARSGLLLPDLEGVETPEQQVSIALRKAGIRPEEKYTMERFEVERHK